MWIGCGAYSNAGPKVRSPGGPRSTQEYTGGARKTQEEPRGPWRSQEEPRGPRRTQVSSTLPFGWPFEQNRRRCCERNSLREIRQQRESLVGRLRMSRGQGPGPGPGLYVTSICSVNVFSNVKQDGWLANLALAIGAVPLPLAWSLCYTHGMIQIPAFVVSSILACCIT